MADFRNFIISELEARSVCVVSDNECILEGSTMSLAECYRSLKKRSTSNKKLIYNYWQDIVKLSSRIDEKGEVCKDIRKLFVPAVKSIYNLSYKYDHLRVDGTCNVLQEMLSVDSDRYNGNVMSKFVDYRIAIEWLDHLIYRDLYICALIRRYARVGKASKEVEARGVGGPWGRLDLPVEERTFSWDDIDEEIRGRSNDIRNQPRYTTGLDGLNDDGVKEGFHWREIRNEPYAFDDEDSNPYPHRNVLFGS